MSGCQTCGGYGMKHDAVAHGWEQENPRCWSFADDTNPECPIGSARCVLPDGHHHDHIWEARQ